MNYVYRPRSSAAQVDRRTRIAADLIQHGYSLQQVADALGLCSKGSLHKELVRHGYPTRQILPPISASRDTYGVWHWHNPSEARDAMEVYHDGPGSTVDDGSTGTDAQADRARRIVENDQPAMRPQ